jgi:hypothetical protein
MRLNDAIQALSNESTALDVLKECQCYFDKVEEISGLFANGVIDTPAECRRVLNEATAIYLALNPLLSLAETEKSNREVIHFVENKRTVENSGGKFVSTAASTEASAAVHVYRRVRNVLEGYVESTKMAASTCQSILRSMSDENRLTNSGNQV